MKFLLAGSFICVGMASFAATPLTESTFTEIIKEAKVVAATDKSVKPAVTNAVFRAPDMVRTGLDSRVEMTAPDQTITRIGANTVFTFDEGERSIRLQKGSILFHSPAGAGGGTIKCGGTAAAVLGTTIICAVLLDGSFKTLVLEGQCKVTLANGDSVTLNAGQYVIVPAEGGGNTFGAVMTFNIGQLVAQLELVQGFSHPLSSLPLIKDAIKAQQQQIADGVLSGFALFEIVGDGLDLINVNGGTGGLPMLLNVRDHTLIPLSPTRP